MPRITDRDNATSEITMHREICNRGSVWRGIKTCVGLSGFLKAKDSDSAIL